MTEVHVVMGREFYASWPVRAFYDLREAEAHASTLRCEYKRLCVPLDVDTVAAETDDWPVERIAEERARAQMAAWDPGCRGGLDLSWDVVTVPLDDVGNGGPP